MQKTRDSLAVSRAFVNLGFGQKMSDPSLLRARSHCAKATTGETLHDWMVGRVAAKVKPPLNRLEDFDQLATAFSNPEMSLKSSLRPTDHESRFRAFFERGRAEGVQPHRRWWRGWLRERFRVY
jgi:hypothetical protein